MEREQMVLLEVLSANADLLSATGLQSSRGEESSEILKLPITSGGSYYYIPFQ